LKLLPDDFQLSALCLEPPASSFFRMPHTYIYMHASSRQSPQNTCLRRYVAASLLISLHASQGAGAVPGGALQPCIERASGGTATMRQMQAHRDRRV